MLRQVGAKGLSAVGGRMGIPLMIIATVFLAILPIVDERKIYLSEGNLKPMATPVASLSDLSAPNPFEHLIDGGAVSTVVRGKRSPGGTLMSVMVNYDATPSVLIASALFNTFQHRRSHILSGDLEFRFFSRSCSIDDNSTHRIPSLEEASWNVPSEVEVVLVLDIAEITFSGNHYGVAGGGAQLCLNVFGSDGVQPNMDIVNLMTMLGAKQGVEWNLLCQQPSLSTSSSVVTTSSSNERGGEKQQDVIGVADIATSLTTVVHKVTDGYVALGKDDANRLGHYALSLLTAAFTGSSPENGGASLRKRGMHPVVVSSLPSRRSGESSNRGRQRAKTSSSSAAPPHNRLLPIVHALEGLIRGVNNLEEQLHHSFPVYLHIGVGSFVDFEVAQHVIFIVLGAIGSDMFSAFRGILAAATASSGHGVVVSEWTALFGSHTRRALLKLIAVLSLSFLAVTVGCVRTTKLNRTITEIANPIIIFVSDTMTSSGVILPPTVANFYSAIFSYLASIPMFLSRTFLPLTIAGWALIAKTVVPLFQQTKSATSEASIGARSLVIGVWNCVVVCLLMAYHPLLALPGSLCIGWLQVWTSMCARQRIVDVPVGPSSSAPSSPDISPVQEKKPSRVKSIAKKLAKLFRRVVSLRLGVGLSFGTFLAGESILVINAMHRGVSFSPQVASAVVNGEAMMGRAGGNELSYEMLQDVNSVFAIFGIAVNVWWFLLTGI